MILDGLYIQYLYIALHGIHLQCWNGEIGIRYIRQLKTASIFPCIHIPLPPWPAILYWPIRKCGFLCHNRSANKSDVIAFSYPVWPTATVVLYPWPQAIHDRVPSMMSPYSLSIAAWLIITLIARFMGPTWGPSGADRTQVGPTLAPRTLLFGKVAFLW